MIKVVFVGDEPTSDNIRQDIAFVGTKSFTRLVEWINVISPDYYVCYNSRRIDDLSAIKDLADAGFKVIALGQKALKRIESIAFIEDFFGLPHPSGLNRKLNNKEYLDAELVKAYKYVRNIE